MFWYFQSFTYIVYFKAFGDSTDRKNRDTETRKDRADIDRYNPGYNNYFGSNAEDNSDDKDGVYR